MSSKLLCLFAAVVLFSGCAVYTPGGSVVVDPQPVAKEGKGNFCPPGQAKKGRC
ncbi:hypothetical protein [Ramlibacter tataouinensis]|uniref:Candidate vir-repressed protein Vir-18 n=1 Tax=Ramlibacter tataouinensis (strain ATCC BAA-407 / DSM 14655 / LMG 21543 / TTB310) TaxID=365046 RepID=F5Y2T2_RAMTT|nr:hypothetical protein [Ramlibacter tataouinensis]AEG93628.1 Candidate vir-repressed protein Vir-18 [Ramlibacter tataouinensis TTB310]